MLGFVLLITLPPGAPLRDPVTGSIVGQTPFMASLLFIVMLCFFIPGIAFGSAVGKYKGPNDVIAAVVKTFAGLGGLIFMLLMISQFIAFFNYSNMPAVIATALAEWLGHAGIPAIPLLVGFVLVIVLLDFIMPGAWPSGRSLPPSSCRSSSSWACRRRPSSPPTGSATRPSTP